jgi:hypothetical protein
MERYVFFDPTRIPPGLPVVGVPTASGFVWVEITAAEYEATVADPDLARQLVTYARAVLTNRLSRPEEHNDG